jgi:hypothetical protein
VKFLSVYSLLVLLIACQDKFKIGKFDYEQRRNYGFVRMSDYKIRRHFVPIENKNIESFSSVQDTFLIDKSIRSPYVILPEDEGDTARRPTFPVNDTIAVIWRPVEFSKCDMNIKGGMFDKPVTTCFLNPVRFSNCSFTKEDNIMHRNYLCAAYFDSSVSFVDNEYTVSPAFLGDTFNALVSFVNGMGMKKPPVFSNCYFAKGLQFNGDLLSDRRGTLGTWFHGDLSFVYSTLFGKLDLSTCHFDTNATLELKETYLPDTLDLSNVHLSKSIDLINTYPHYYNKKCEILLINTDIEKVKMQYTNFHLCFPDSILANAGSRDLVSSTYESLLNNFKKNNFHNSYVELDKEYKAWQSRYNWTLILSDVWWKFGYEKWRILVWTGLFILLFTVFNFSNYTVLQTVYPIEKLHWKKIPFKSVWALFSLKRLFSVLLYTGLIFFRLSIDFKALNFYPMRYAAMVIFQYTIGLVCTGFMINWILQG